LIKLLFVGTIGIATYNVMASQTTSKSMAELTVDAESGIEMLSENFLESSAQAEMKLIAEEEAELALAEEGQ